MQAAGKLAVKVTSANGLPRSGAFYCVLSLENQEKKTNKTRGSTSNPIWNEQIHFTVTNSNSKLSVLVKLGNDTVGETTIDISELPSGNSVDKEYPLKTKGKSKSTIFLHLLYSSHQVKDVQSANIARKTFEAVSTTSDDASLKGYRLQALRQLRNARPSRKENRERAILEELTFLSEEEKIYSQKQQLESVQAITQLKETLISHLEEIIGEKVKIQDDSKDENDNDNENENENENDNENENENDNENNIEMENDIEMENENNPSIVLLMEKKNGLFFLDNSSEVHQIHKEEKRKYKEKV
ncbi:conserved serine proline-rich protein [Anaeramoeba ignava]|uniref:Conserved serine proline-rich protein n=1 Tax=Anaeramoeba ignava TaxID=1746090 RepID=A0A9Q0R8G7_ANAIG|nr:conserved serine proline-rich protein [Anaeramoeba ignava]